MRSTSKSGLSFFIQELPGSDFHTKTQKVKLIIIQDLFSCSLLIKQGYWSDFQFVILSKVDGILCFLPIGSDK